MAFLSSLVLELAAALAAVEVGLRLLAGHLDYETALLALLLRFIQPAAGTIHVGGADLAEIPVSGWRSQIAWVPQHPYLFAGSAADNIALGRLPLARAFLRDAPLLLLDEPAAHLDQASARHIGGTIAALPAGRTLILVTHDTGWAAGAGPVIRLDHGRLIRCAMPAGVAP